MVLARSVSETAASVREVAAQFRTGALTVRESTERALRAALASRSQLNSMISVPVEEAIASATRLDRELASGMDRGLLHGIPIVHKDAFDTAGVRTTVGSRACATRVPTADAAVVRQLREAGVVTVGKANMSEFACGLSGADALRGVIRNPHDPSRTAGGSSGGTAAAVAAGVCTAGTGSDTGGSIRVPAFYNGLVGLRPTWGRLDLQGAFPRAPTLDVPGPLGRTVDDVTVMFAAMEGRRTEYPRTERLAEGATDVPYMSPVGFRVGVVENWTFDGVDEGVGGSIVTALERLSARGTEPINVEVTALEQWRNEHCMTVLLYEFARGIRAWAVDELRMGQAAKADLEAGREIPERAYVLALEKRAHFTAEMRAVFSQVDLLIAPVMPQAAPAADAGPHVFQAGRRFLLPASFAGLPAIAVPCGQSDSGMPLGVQMIGPPDGEQVLLSAAKALETAG